MSNSTRCLNSVSEINIPAMKAPKAKLSPASSVNQASPKVTNNTLSTNNSSVCRRATSSNHQRIKRWPPVSNNVMSTVALTTARPKAEINCSGGASSAGIRTKKGTTAKSWNSKTPNTRLPCSESSSKRSDMSLITMAELLMDKAPAKVNAVCQLMPQSVGAMVFRNTEKPVTKTTVKATCQNPKPNTKRCIDLNLGKLNSRPMTNIKKTTPNSAK